MIKVTNQEFLDAIFGDLADWVHVTDFPDDPSNIAPERRMRCWSGNYYSRYVMTEGTNQYFTISQFWSEDDKARRRKALFRQTHCLVLDDVREKLSHVVARRLPKPTWIMETSRGSEQWGYILETPEIDRHRIDNLNDGLIASDLAPSGKDPGQRGVTRYVRLPEGVNTKQKKLNADGTPWKCRMLEWEPDSRVSIESLAEVFNIDLDAERRDSVVDGAAEVPDHPLLHIPELIQVKGSLSKGRFDVKCPWVHEHTGQADDGAAIFTNSDGSIGFKCHHGVCETRTGRDLMSYIEEEKPGFQEQFKAWNFMHNMKEISVPSIPVPPTVAPPPPIPNFLEPQPTSVAPPPPILQASPDQDIGYEDMIKQIGRQPIGQVKNGQAYEFLKMIDDLDHGTRIMYWNDLRDIMHWSKTDLTAVIEQQRKKWYKREGGDTSFYRDYVYVAEQNQYYSATKRQFLSVDSFRNAYCHIDSDVHTEALVEGRVEKVDRYDYLPGMPNIFTEKGIRHVNGFVGIDPQPIKGDVARWLNHFEVLGWEKERDHILKWMAHTIRHPEIKINHMILLAGGEGVGKDFLLYPMFQALAGEHRVIDGHDLIGGFNDYLIGVKNLHINELEMGDHREARAVTNKLKPYCTAPPMTLSVNPKGTKGMQIRNLINVSGCSNSALPMSISGDTRRFFAVWTDMIMRDPVTRQLLPGWGEYWGALWHWMISCEGWKACTDYLLTRVDLSDFNPAAPPHVTDFVRDMQDASADPIGNIIRELVDLEMGSFQSDIMTSEDVYHALKISAQMMNLSNTVNRIPSAATLGKILRQEKLAVLRRCTAGKKEYRLWILRDREKYEKMPGNEIVKKYLLSMEQIRNSGELQIIEGGLKEA